MLPSIKPFHQVQLIKDQKSWSACVAIHNLYKSKGNNGDAIPPKLSDTLSPLIVLAECLQNRYQCENWTCYFVIFADNKWTKVGKMVNISWVCQNNVIKIESSIWAVRKIVWAHLFILERYQGTIFFLQILNTLTDARERITHDNDSRNKNCMQSAVLLQCNSQALLDARTTAGCVFLSPLLCPGCIKWIKALRAAKHIFISSTLRMRAADSIL